MTRIVNKPASDGDHGRLGSKSSSQQYVVPGRGDILQTPALRTAFAETLADTLEKAKKRTKMRLRYLQCPLCGKTRKTKSDDPFCPGKIMCARRVRGDYP